MSPWDELRYFQVPRPTYLTINTATPTQLVKADMRRVALMFQSPNGVFFVSPDSTLASIVPTTSQTGIAVNSTADPFIMLQKDWGAWVQADWFCVHHQAAALVVTVFECLLYDWPNETNGDYDATESGYIRSIVNPYRIARDGQPVESTIWDQILSARR